jgi:outer membrane receptor protein involved in Fe transport
MLLTSIEIWAAESAENSAQTPTVELEALRVEASEEKTQIIETPKLLRVPGSGGDPLRAIEALPGVVFSSGRRSEPAVRGSSPKDNKYMIDYLPIDNIFHFDGSSILNDNVIDKFSLEAAAFDAQYTNATGAVIDTTTRAPYPDQAQGILDLSLLKASLLLETPIDDQQSVYLSVRYSLIQYYIEALLDDDDFQFTTVPEYYDYQGKYHVALNETDSLTFQVIGARDKAGILFADDSDQVKKDPSLAGGLSFESNFHTQGLTWEHYLDNGALHQSSLSHKVSDIDFVIGQAGDLTATANDYSLYSRINQPIGLHHNLRAGFEYVQTHINFEGDLSAPPCTELQTDCRLEDSQGSIIASDRLVISSSDVFIADDWDVTSTLRLTPGLLFSHDDYSEQFFAQPKLKSRWEFSDGWWINAAYGEYHKFADNYGQVDKDFGNPDLKQSTSTHYFFGIEQQLNDDWLWKIDTYYKTFDDLITGRLSKNDPLYQGLSPAQYAAIPRYENNAKGDAYGVEFFVNKDFSDKWYGWASLAYANTEREHKLTKESFKYNYDQPWIINLVSSYELSKGWTLGVKWRYQSGQLITPITGATPDATKPGLFNPEYGKLNSERLPAYHKMDIRLDKNIKRWNTDVYIEILNAYNQKNTTDYDYDPEYKKRTAVTDLPFLMSFGAKIEF